jgi:hypothetical protein
VRGGLRFRNGLVRDCHAPRYNPSSSNSSSRSSSSSSISSGTLERGLPLRYVSGLWLFGMEGPPMDCRSPTVPYDRLDPAALDLRVVSTPRRGVWPLITESDGAAGAFPFGPKVEYRNRTRSANRPWLPP